MNGLVADGLKKIAGKVSFLRKGKAGKKRSPSSSLFGGASRKKLPIGSLVRDATPYLLIAAVPSAARVAATVINKEKIENQEIPLSELDKALLIRKRMREIGERSGELSPAETIIANGVAKAEGAENAE